MVWYVACSCGLGSHTSTAMWQHSSRRYACLCRLAGEPRDDSAPLQLRFAAEGVLEAWLLMELQLDWSVSDWQLSEELHWLLSNALSGESLTGRGRSRNGVAGDWTTLRSGAVLDSVGHSCWLGSFEVAGLLLSIRDSAGKAWGLFRSWSWCHATEAA